MLWAIFNMKAGTICSFTPGYGHSHSQEVQCFSACYALHDCLGVEAVKWKWRYQGAVAVSAPPMQSVVNDTDCFWKLQWRVPREYLIVYDRRWAVSKVLPYISEEKHASYSGQVLAWINSKFAVKYRRKKKKNHTCQFSCFVKINLRMRSMWSVSSPEVFLPPRGTITYS